jgi:hypothetical protein
VSGGNDVDIVAAWSTRIAERAAPDEVDLAPAMAAAFVRGGRDRRDLLRPSATGDPGGFVAAFPLPDFPSILQALEAAARSVPAFLNSEVLGNLLGGAGLLMTIRSRPVVESSPPTPVQPPAAPAPSASEPNQTIVRVVARLAAELVAAGIDASRATQVACDVLEALLEDPEGAAEFVERIGGGGPR